jgi:inner membrane protein
MLLFGHVGITFGAALAADAVGHRSAGTKKLPSSSPLTWLHERTASLSQRVDLRVLVLGSLLPDVIDKPVGLLLFPGYFGTGRLYAHALLFPLVLGLVGARLYRSRGAVHLLVLAYGSFMHLVLDAMWRSPVTLLWPLLGPLEPGHEAGDWMARLIQTLLTNPAAYASEIAGAILLAPLLWAILGRAAFLRFLRSGKVD